MKRRDQSRSNGMSVRDIASMLSVSKGTVSHWVRDVQLTEKPIDALKTNRRKYGAQNAGHKPIVRNI